MKMGTATESFPGSVCPPFRPALSGCVRSRLYFVPMCAGIENPGEDCLPKCIGGGSFHILDWRKKNVLVSVVQAPSRGDHESINRVGSQSSVLEISEAGRDAWFGVGHEPQSPGCPSPLTLTVTAVLCWYIHPLCVIAWRHKVHWASGAETIISITVIISEWSY